MLSLFGTVLCYISLGLVIGFCTVCLIVQYVVKKNFTIHKDKINNTITVFKKDNNNEVVEIKGYKDRGDK